MPTSQQHSLSLAVSVGVETHVGKLRTENQDRVTRAATPFGDLFVVADGVGGYKGGAQAAQSTVEGFVDFLSSHGNLELRDALQQAVRHISAGLLQRSTSDQSFRGMGSTVVLCIIRGNRATYAHAGDSRAYLVRGGHLRQLTRDHSVMERLVSQGMLAPAEARQHPDASVLTRALGQSADISLDIGELELLPNDCLLLCSDGLWGYAQESEIEAVVTSTNLSPSGVATAILNLALEGGGGDNISVQFLRFSAIVPARRVALVLGIPLKVAVPILGSAVALAGSAFGLWEWNHRHPIDNPHPDSSFTIVVPAASAPAPGPVPNPPSQVQQPHPAAAAPVQPKPTAPSAGAATQASSSAGTSIILVRDNHGKVVTWVDNLSSIQYLEPPVKEVGSTACLAMQKNEETLYYISEKRDVARRVHSALPQPKPALAEMTKQESEACGGGELVAMPASTPPAMPSAIQAIENKVKSGIKSTVESGKEKTDEVKGSVPIPHVDPQP